MRSVQALSPTATKTGGILSRAGHCVCVLGVAVGGFWRDQQVTHEENPVTMGISPILPWELKQWSTLLLSKQLQSDSRRLW